MSARILVVEDDRTMAEVLLAYLRRAVYETNWTTDGSKAHSPGGASIPTWSSSTTIRRTRGSC